MQSDVELAIQTRELSQTIGAFALRDIGLCIPDGALCALVGGSGSGKTTLLKLILGLTDPDTGQRLIFGQDVSQGPLQTRVRYAPQADLLPEKATIQEALRFTTFLSGQAAIDSASVETVLNLVHLTVPLHTSVVALTALQRRYLWLARALIGQPQLLVLDEPAGSLRDTGRQEFLKTLRQIGTGRTVIYATSLPADACQASNYIAVLHKGRLVAQGPTGDVLKNADYAIYQLTISGNASTVYDLLIEQAWIHAIRVDRQDDHEVWMVLVHDEYQAERGLLRAVLADRKLHVANYSQLRPRLRDVLNHIETAPSS